MEWQHDGSARAAIQAWQGDDRCKRQLLYAKARQCNMTDVAYVLKDVLSGKANRNAFIAADRGTTLLEHGRRERASSLEGVDDLAIRLLRKCFHGHRADIPKPTQHQGKPRCDGVVRSVENADKVVLSRRQIKRVNGIVDLIRDISV